MGKFNLKELYQKSKTKIQDISKSTSKEINNGIHNVQSNMKKVSDSTQNQLMNTRDKISQWSNSTQKQLNVIMTNTGRKIKTNPQNVRLLTTGVITGVTGIFLFQKMYQDNHSKIKEFKEERAYIQSYQQIIDKNSEDMKIYDWRAYVANISAHLETQLRFQLDLEDTNSNHNLNGLLVEAEKSQLLSEEEIRKLHLFRSERNNLLHNIEIEKLDIDTIKWTSYFVFEF